MKVAAIAFLVVLVIAYCDAQVNFTPGWGKRALAPGGGTGSGGDVACKTPIDSLMYIYKLVQAEAQKIVDCERLSNM